MPTQALSLRPSTCGRMTAVEYLPHLLVRWDDISFINHNFKFITGWLLFAPLLGTWSNHHSSPPMLANHTFSWRQGQGAPHQRVPLRCYTASSQVHVCHIIWQLTDHKYHRRDTNFDVLARWGRFLENEQLGLLFWQVTLSEFMMFMQQ